MYTNTTRSTVSYPKKGGGTVDIRAGETSTEQLDTDHAQVAGALLSGVIVEGKKGAAPAGDSIRNRVSKPE